MTRETIELGGLPLTLETGRMAKQADGAIWLTLGETTVLATVCANLDAETDFDFMPLTVDYREKLYAVGRIPGGFFKREGRPSEKETLSARLTDRPLRPLFPDGFNKEVQIMINVLSSDGEHDPDVLGTIAASAALSISQVPFLGPVGSVRMAYVDGEFIVNPAFKQLENSALDVVVAGTAESIMMIEGLARLVDEDTFLKAIEIAHGEIKRIVELQNALVKKIGKTKAEFVPRERNTALAERLSKDYDTRVRELLSTPEKQARKKAMKAIVADAAEALETEFPEEDGAIKEWVNARFDQVVRQRVVKDKVRLDGRGPTDIRPITCEIDILPRVHGSALFTRGQTQALGSITLGAKFDEQKVDGIDGVYFKPYMLHYNFPPFSVGEVRKFLGQSRREVGHGNLAWRAIQPVLPAWDDFPYTIRVVSEVLESNGSSSMATVCAGCMSLMAGGVPLKAPVAGIAMGLIEEDGDVAILSDILGDEDHLGDMDFKVTGNEQGITACQMDIKITGISIELMRTAIRQARQGIEHILNKMREAIPEPRPMISPFAPRIAFFTVDPDKIGLIIGPGGRTIRDIIARSGAQIDIEDTGQICISGPSSEEVEKALSILRGMTENPEVGKTYDGRVTKITDFGAFVEILPGREGLLHISEIEYHRVAKVSDHLKVGDPVDVKLVKITPEGKLDLSRKALLPKPEGYVEEPPRERHDRGHGGKGGHDKRPRREKVNDE
ncbi:MAG: polyribonucleotide nucleotidyltransferase [Calditrichaeota bacterium]|nr:polyribonucleotide nucleotidyltransferase [Calditrichota bacterium]MCB9366521.1 polyribonucleotide nucleotidyltransferase [Calditrichota bacterium]MCB9391221.1 polyribonucleotide nucleotidyltransferase [Calditrichota bacterium]